MSKSAAKLNFSAKREQPRKFGEFHGEDGLEMQPPSTSIWQNSPCKYRSSFPDFLPNLFQSSHFQPGTKEPG